MAKVQLSPAEIARFRKPIRGKGGFQTLLRRIAGNIKDDGSVNLTTDDAEKLLRYSFKYGGGGFEDRMKATAKKR
jgi:hypothetical protein